MKKFLLSLYPIQFFIKVMLPLIRFSTQLPKINGRQYLQLTRCLKKGDIILLKDTKKLSHYLIKGDMDHAAVAVMESQTWQISEMVQKGYNKTTIFDLAKESDQIIVLRFRDETKVQNFVDKCKSFEDTKYDTYFSLSSNKLLYCTELVLKSSTKEDIGLTYHGEIEPDDLLSAKNLYLVYDSDWYKTNCPVLETTTNKEQ